MSFSLALILASNTQPKLESKIYIKDKQEIGFILKLFAYLKRRNSGNIEI